MCWSEIRERITCVIVKVVCGLSDDTQAERERVSEREREGRAGVHASCEIDEVCVIRQFVICKVAARLYRARPFF